MKTIKLTNKRDAKIKALFYLSSMANIIMDDLSFEDDKSMSLMAESLDELCMSLENRYKKMLNNEN